MHELSLCESIVQTLEQQAQLHHYRKVECIRLEVGALSSVDSETLRFCFESVALGTLAENARLEIIEIPGVARCLACGRLVDIKHFYDQCFFCGGHRMQVCGGTEMRIKELEVE